ncbi:MAG: hypothetical protein BroJett007_28800 [Chloroflexota bacterium]|nr:MAG: hypothetical protein BroJett007_28800 [Chloroflexota bacterium]
MRSAASWVTEPSAAAPNSVRVLRWPVRPNGIFAMVMSDTLRCAFRAIIPRVDKRTGRAADGQPGFSAVRWFP